MNFFTFYSSNNKKKRIERARLTAASAAAVRVSSGQLYPFRTTRQTQIGMIRALPASEKAGRHQKK